ncbi:MAG: phage terminase small subunit P27 family [bacterium]|nr:phage terminase small subunit P27 family [bacterium]
MVKGRKPTPTAQKKARGNPGKRPLSNGEPQFSTGTSCPRWLPEDAKTEWKRVYPELTNQKVLTKVDRQALVAYCLAWAEVKQLTEFLAQHKRHTVKTSTTVKAMPEVAMRQAAIQTMLKAAAELGMSPSARSRVQGSGDAGDDPLAKLIAQRDQGKPPKLRAVK